MAATSTIFDLMRATEMNDWVGGSDPQQVGDASTYIVRRMLPVEGHSRVLDFGCGIGRTILSLLAGPVVPAQIVGVDIMPPVIDFCRQHIEPAFPQTRFELIEGANDHYDQFIGQAARKPISQLTTEYGGSFDLAYAFSVFTHIDRKDFVGLLKTVAALLKPGGSFLFTCFTLTEFSRNMLANRQSVFKFNDSAFIDDGDVFIGERNDPLAFIAFDKMLLERMVWEAGLTITTLEYGAWMGGRLGSSLHDLIVVRRPFDLSNPDDIAKTPTVDRSAGNQ